MSQVKHKILCVDGDDDTRELLAFVLNDAGFAVEVCSTAAECLENVTRTEFQAVIIDGFFGNLSSAGLCRELRQLDANIPLIYLSGEARSAEIEKAFAAGADAYLVKPNDFEKLTETVFNLIEKV